MTSEQNRIDPPLHEKFVPTLEILARISQMEEAWLENPNEGTTHHLLNEGMPLFDRVIDLFHAADESTMEVWTTLQKASLTVDLVSACDQHTRMQLTRDAFELVQHSFKTLVANPPERFPVTVRLHLLVIETLIKIRDLFDDHDQVAALVELIQGISAHLGEFLALDHSMRTQAADQLFTAHVLETLSSMEEDPLTHREMIEKAQHLALQAYDQLSMSSATDLQPAVSLLAALAHQQTQDLTTDNTNCPQCGHQSPIGTPYCSQCGARLTQEVGWTHSG